MTLEESLKVSDVFMHGCELAEANELQVIYTLVVLLRGMNITNPRVVTVATHYLMAPEDSLTDLGVKAFASEYETPLP